MRQGCMFLYGWDTKETYKTYNNYVSTAMVATNLKCWRWKSNTFALLAHWALGTFWTKKLPDYIRLPHKKFILCLQFIFKKISKL